KLNEVFGGEISEEDKLSYVTGTILGKVVQSKTLQQQAASNTKEQFSTSPDLRTELQNAVIASYDAHTAMSTKALNSPVVLEGLLEILLQHAKLYEALRAKAA